VGAEGADECRKIGGQILVPFHWFPKIEYQNSSRWAVESIEFEASY
jgi:hypothetical protein